MFDLVWYQLHDGPNKGQYRPAYVLNTDEKNGDDLIVFAMPGKDQMPIVQHITTSEGDAEGLYSRNHPDDKSNDSVQLPFPVTSDKAVAQTEQDDSTLHTTPDVSTHDSVATEVPASGNPPNDQTTVNSAVTKSNGKDSGVVAQ